MDLHKELNAIKKLQRFQRICSRCKKSSRNRQKVKDNLQRCHARIDRIRQDTLHKLTFHLTEVYGCIAIDDHHVKGMLKKSRLARSIADMGFYKFRRQLEYKAKMKGSQVVTIDRFFPPTKLCSECLTRHGIQLSQRF
ncbi:MAG: RNA-guided endonuclease InsQ/TnpB family protein [Oligoflexales bacterium]